MKASIFGVAALTLVGCGGLEAGDSPGDDGGGGPGGGGVGGEGSVSVKGLDATETDNGNDPPQFDPELCQTSEFTVAVRSQRMASPAFAIAAVRRGAWPYNVDRSSFVSEEFLAYFTTFDNGHTYGRLVDGPDGSKFFEGFVEQPADSALAPLDLIVVVDTSSSMRNDLTLAADTIRSLGDRLSASQVADSLTIVEWGGTPSRFESRATGASISKLVENFSSRAVTLTEGQLGPGGSLLSALEPVTLAVADTTAPHVVVLTDGGVVADTGSFQAIESWTSAGAIVSVVEVQSAQDALPKTYHRASLEALANAGGGATFYVTPDTLDILSNRFDDALRPALSNTSITYQSGAISPVVEAASANASVFGGWVGADRPLFTRVPVNVCNAELVTVLVKSPLLPEELELTLPAEGDVNVARLAIVDRLVTALSEGCTDAVMNDLSTLGDDLLALELPDTRGFGEISQLVSSMKAACGVLDPNPNP